MSIKRTSGKRATSGVKGLIHRIPVLSLGIAMTACAHKPSESPLPASPSKELAAMNAPATDAYRPHTLDEFPELTPEEIGQRFLKLIDSLKSIEELSFERLQGAMRLRFTPTPETHGGFFTMHLPESGWYYGLSYYDDPELKRKSITYQFTNRPAGQENNDDGADMAPVCGMDFYAYVAELKKMGFVEREDLAQYDSPMPPAVYDPKTGKESFAERKFFRLPGYTFTRGNVGVLIRERREVVASDAKPENFCVESISVGTGA
ncbi:hypothetical protein [Xanthomonas bonasiae]|uniref:hypothetical protein n=1 Tax=Xanthomonas bonasiae TaxID=2810351 RepID=UPI00177EC843|nr:hypothetical protein [Xanthomonas surreyensis]MBD7923978.1 hypothetical protein [Xanthomonas surreyensis]